MGRIKSIKKIKSKHTNSHYIHSDNDTEEDSCHDFAEFFVFRSEELVVHHEKDTRQTEKKYGIVVHRCGKVQPQSRKMRPRHTAEGTADAKNPISRADAAEIF